MRRRSFLSAGSLAVLLPGCALVPVLPKRPAPSLEDAVGWVRHEDGRYLVQLPRAEMGQNIATAFHQIACDELGVAWDAVEVRMLRTTRIARVKATVGSESIRDFALPLAQACASLRLALARGESGAVLQAQEIPMEQLRSFSPAARRARTLAPQAHGREIVTGRPLYASDVRLPRMLYGRVLRAPLSPERASRPAHRDEAAARQVPGFVAVVEDARLQLCNAAGLGIVATTPGALDRIEMALSVDWAGEAADDQSSIGQRIDVDPRLSRGPLSHVETTGSIAAGEPWTVDLRLEVPLAPHNAMEPRAAVAEPGEVLRIWSGGQDPFFQRDTLARAFGLAAEQVDVQSMRMGGGFGGKTLCTVELEAAVLARAVGRPVKVQWTRAQELAHGFHRPPSSHRVRARLRDGQLTDWWHAFASSHILFTNAGMPPWMQRVADFVGDAGVARGSAIPYRCPRQRVEYDLERLPALTGPWRGLGAGPNLLAIESAIDECALASGADPLAFRLRHLEDSRLATVLQRAADMARWRPPTAPAPGPVLLGRGIAGGIYKGMSYAAAVAEVRVDVASGAVRVTRLWCAHDCGLVINPDQVAAQAEGNLVWCIGTMLVEELPFERGEVQARTFAEAPMPRMADMARMEIELIDSPHAPGGAGETAMVAGAAAISNALRNAIGVRFTRVPVRPADVLRALRG